MSDKLTDEKFEELKTQFGEVVVVETKLGPCVFRCYKRAEYDRYMSFLFDEKKRHKAQEIIVRSTVVYPSTAQFDEMVDRAPGIITTCTSAVLELGGQTGEPEIRKS